MERKLLMYQGGGYDGCIWEWNAGYFDENGKYHDLFSSGYKGINSNNVRGDLTDFALTYIDLHEEGGNRPADYDLFDVRNLDAFTSLYDPAVVLMVSRALEDFDIEVGVKCSECGNLSTPDETIIEMATKHSFTAICSECYSMWSCGYCGEYFGEDYEWQEHENYGHVCEYCMEE